MKILVKTSKHVDTTTTKTSLNYRKANWHLFKCEINKELDSLAKEVSTEWSTLDIDRIIKAATIKIHDVKSKCIPTFKPANNNTGELPDHIINILNKKKRALKIKHNTYNPHLKAEMSKLIRELNYNYTSQMKELYNNRLANKLKAININNDTFKEINKITGNKRWKEHDEGLLVNGHATFDELLQAKEFKRYYGTIYTEDTPATNHFLKEVEEKWRKIDVSTCQAPEKVTTEEDIKWILKGLKGKKSEGPDGISNALLKKMPYNFCILTAKIANRCLETGYFPEEWKKTIIAPIPKCANAKLAEDFRPIHLLSNWSKILESVILLRLTDEDGQPIGVPDIQFAYRKQHSAINAVDWLKKEVYENKRTRFFTGICALDVSKAFDKVWIKGLVYRLSNLVDETTTKILKSFLINRRAVVKVGNSYSSKFNLQSGVPQGSKLGPVLYNIYTSKITNTENLIQYADDLLIWNRCKAIAPIKTKMENDIRQVKTEMARWGIRINEAKTKYLITDHGGRRAQTRVNNAREVGLFPDRNNVPLIKGGNKLKYLGIVMNSDNNGKDAIEHAIKKGNIAFSKLRNLLRNKELALPVKTLIYNQLLKPVLLYGSELWEEGDNITELEEMERKWIREYTGLYRKKNGHYYSNDTIYRAAGIKINIRDAIDKRRERYEEKVYTHPNTTMSKRFDTLIGKDRDMLIRNNEYQAHTSEWKKKWKETVL